AHAWVVLGVWWFIHPAVALWGLVSLPLSIAAAGLLFKYRNDAGQLKTAIVLTILAAVVHGLAMTIGLTALSLGFAL
ncbi:MAG: prenyltransferase, partial [Betaproteobacteria bacterium]|nr:prenyltransferase [Betaproteobacteria bacterium]